MARKGLRCVYSFFRRWTAAYFYDTEAVNRDKKINENFIGGAANETTAAPMLLRLV